MCGSNPFMITDCFGAQRGDLSGTETIFVQGVFVLVKILIPVAIWVYTWNICRSDRAHHRTSLLGLEETQVGQTTFACPTSATRALVVTCSTPIAVEVAHIRATITTIES